MGRELDKLMHDVEYQKKDLLRREKLLEEYKQRELESLSTEKSWIRKNDKNVYIMYSIREKPFKLQVPCKNCSDKGYIDKTCHACNGKGIHNKGFMAYEVNRRTEEIEKIDRDSKTGELRYWEDLSCFYYESSKLIHFNKKDAQHECDKRNIEKFGREFYKQYLIK